jgi:hypothetical protein
MGRSRPTQTPPHMSIAPAEPRSRETPHNLRYLVVSPEPAPPVRRIYHRMPRGASGKTLRGYISDATAIAIGSSPLRKRCPRSHPPARVGKAPRSRPTPNGSGSGNRFTIIGRPTDESSIYASSHTTTVIDERQEVQTAGKATCSAATDRRPRPWQPFRPEPGAWSATYLVVRRPTRDRVLHRT